MSASMKRILGERSWPPSSPSPILRAVESRRWPGCHQKVAVEAIQSILPTLSEDLKVVSTRCALPTASQEGKALPDADLARDKFHTCLLLYDAVDQVGHSELKSRVRAADSSKTGAARASA